METQKELRGKAALVARKQVVASGISNILEIKYCRISSWLYLMSADSSVNAHADALGTTWRFCEKCKTVKTQYQKTNEKSFVDEGELMSLVEPDF